MLRYLETWKNLQRKHRPIRPCTTAIIVCLFVLAGLRTLTPQKVTIERQIDRSEHYIRSGKPSISNILDWSSDLQLSKEQTKSLLMLANKERQELTELDLRMNDALSKFQKFKANSQGKRITLPEIQAAGQPISELSVNKRMIIEDFAEDAESLLNTKQKKQASKLLSSRVLHGGNAFYR